MYDSGPSDAELEAFGLKREDVENKDTTEIWPENWLPFKVFVELDTSWNVGPGGPVGLNWQAVPVWFDLMKVSDKKRFDVSSAIRVMEKEALRQMTKKE